MDSFACPVCGLVSYNANDIREGFCGYCHDWTGDIQYELDFSLPVTWRHRDTLDVPPNEFL